MSDTIDGELVRCETPAAMPANALADLRQQAMGAPVEIMRKGLTEYLERRDEFRKWLRPQLKTGVHFGFPPSCLPKYVDDHGRDCTEENAVATKIWNGKKNAYDLCPLNQWKPKPSFYKAGAEFVCDLLGLICVFEADMAAWEQLGKPHGTFVTRCRLYPKGAPHADEHLVGEGRGVRRVGTKGGDDNNAIKMSEKSAKVAAILNAFGLADLFTQDLEDAGATQHDNPTQIEFPPIVEPRDKRVGKDELVSLMEAWQAMRRREKLEHTNAQYAAWCEDISGQPADDVFLVLKWTIQRFNVCRATILKSYPEDES
jgi:hypothetical protein